MNKLREYIESLPREERVPFKNRLAARLGVSEMMVRHMANGIRRVAAHHCIAIEEETGGFARRHDLRPDVFGSVQSQSRSEVGYRQNA